jgi:hypothetical protein
VEARVAIGGMSWTDAAVWTMGLAAGMELLTLGLRFGLGLKSREATRGLARWTRGVRVHHGYVGAAVMLAGTTPALPAVWTGALLVVGGALLLSDLVHHFAVLWPLTGSPEFDLRYAVSVPARAEVDGEDGDVGGVDAGDARGLAD